MTCVHQTSCGKTAVSSRNHYKINSNFELKILAMLTIHTQKINLLTPEFYI